MKKINKEEVLVFKESKDPNFMFLHEGSLYRLIQNSHILDGRWGDIQEFVASEWYNSLMSEGWVPRMEPADICLNGYSGDIYRVEEIPYVTHENEWTFAQKIDALIFVCNLNQRLISCGSKWIANDCNIGQVTFRGAFPVFVDAGGFSSKHRSMARSKVLADMEKLIGVEALNGAPIEVGEEFFGWAASVLERNRGSSVKISTQWDQYASLEGDASLRMSDPRFKREASFILDWVESLEGCERVVDVGANTGYFAFLFASMGKEVMALDLSEKAIGELYDINRARKLPITCACVNIMKSGDKVPYRDWRNRFIGDLAFVSSVTHHIYRSGWGFREQAALWRRLAARYLLVEYIDPQDQYVGKWNLDEDYNREEFESSLRPEWEILRSSNRHEKARTWYLCERRNPVTADRVWA